MARPRANPSRIIDLDAARRERAAARSEADSEPVVLRLGGRDYTLPVEMPVDFALLGQAGDLRGAVIALLGDVADSFFASTPSVDDLNSLVRIANDVYGVGEGKPPASPSS